MAADEVSLRAYAPILSSGTVWLYRCMQTAGQMFYEWKTLAVIFAIEAIAQDH